MRSSRRQPLPFRPRGGKREGAGRKPTVPGKPRLRHQARPAADARFPVHVTMRIGRAVPRLRQFELGKLLRRAFVYGCKHGEFRICQFSIQSNHIHMICEAHTAEARAKGIQGWAVRVARGINGACGRRGRVFDDRYHLEALTTPTQVRNALCYVLQNARRHGVRLDPRFHGADPFSSAWWFDGWQDASWKLGLDPPEVRTVAAAESWLLRVGWQRAKAGRFAIDEVPAAGLARSRPRGRRAAGIRDPEPEIPAKRTRRREISPCVAPPGRRCAPGAVCVLAGGSPTRVAPGSVSRGSLHFGRAPPVRSVVAPRDAAPDGRDRQRAGCPHHRPLSDRMTNAYTRTCRPRSGRLE